MPGAAWQDLQQQDKVLQCVHQPHSDYCQMGEIEVKALTVKNAQ